MISADTAAKLLTRGVGLKKFPSDAIAWEECRRAFAKAAQNADHATAIVERIIETCAYFPVPAEIYEIALAVPSGEPEAAEATWSYRRTCERCQGSGFAHGLWLVTWDNKRRSKEPLTREQASALSGKLAGIGVQQIYEGCSYCDCTYGQQLQLAKDMHDAEAR